MPVCTDHLVEIDVVDFKVERLSTGCERDLPSCGYEEFPMQCSAKRGQVRFGRGYSNADRILTSLNNYDEHEPEKLKLRTFKMSVSDS